VLGDRFGNPALLLLGHRAADAAHELQALRRPIMMSKPSSCVFVHIELNVNETGTVVKVWSDARAAILQVNRKSLAVRSLTL
jgi:hypothetical protein